MKKLLFVTLFLFAVFGWHAESGAVIGTIDAVPSVTVLLPYFEVDLSNPNGQTTLFSINNAGAAALLAHVVLWTDMGVAAFGFNVYLTGYDIQTINLRDIFNGTVPRTASAGQDPTDTISPRGTFSQDINFASCSGQLPPPPLPADFIQHLRDAFTGNPSAFFSGSCAGLDHGDSIARGYVTIDVVNNCTLRVPGELGYFESDTINNRRLQIPPMPLPPGPDYQSPDAYYLIWGDYFYVNPGQNFSQGDLLVSVEADNTNPETSVAGQYTFYGRYVNWLATDRREPLATNFAVRFVNGGGFTGGTNLIVWRDSKVNQLPFSCSTVPAWYPLGQEEIVVFDEQENGQVLPSSESPFPAAAMRTKVGGPDLPVTPLFGWFHLNLNTTVAAAGANPPEDPAAAQAWVSTTMDAEGRYSVSFPAIRLDSATAATHTLLFP